MSEFLSSLPTNLDVSARPCKAFAGCWVADYDDSRVFTTTPLEALKYGFAKLQQYALPQWEQSPSLVLSSIGPTEGPRAMVDFFLSPSLPIGDASANQTMRGYSCFSSSRGMSIAAAPALEFPLYAISIEPLQEKRDRMFASCVDLLAQSAPDADFSFRHASSRIGEEPQLDFDRFADAYFAMNKEALNRARAKLAMRSNRAAYLRPDAGIPVIKDIYAVDLHPVNRRFGKYDAVSLTDAMTAAIPDQKLRGLWHSLAVTHPEGTIRTLWRLRDGQDSYPVNRFLGREKEMQEAVEATARIPSFQAPFACIWGALEEPQKSLGGYMVVTLMGQKDWGLKPITAVVSDPQVRGSRSAGEMFLSVRQWAKSTSGQMTINNWSSKAHADAERWGSPAGKER